MNTMTIGGITLEYLPDDCTDPRAQKSIGVVDTYSGVQVFDWGKVLPGTKISLSWDLMSLTEFDQLDTVYTQEGTVVWVSGIRSKSYNVVITKLDGKLIDGAEDGYRKNVSMELVIVSEVL